MRLLKPLRRAALIAAVPVAFGLTSNAYAVGTSADTNVTNTATLSYTVSGVAQPNEVSNTTDFEVDNRVDVVVAWQDGANVPAVDGQTGVVMEFTVRNDGNATQDFALTTSNDATDNFDPNTVSIFVEDGTTPGYQALEDTATFIDELGENLTATVYVVANLLAGQVDGDIARVNLIAQARESGNATVLGAVEAEDAVNTALGVETVWGDGAGTDLTGPDVAEDGFHSDQGGLVIVSADVTVAKAATVLRDPFNGAANPLAIPGAVIQYQITVTNDATASGAAVLTQIIDNLVAPTQFDPDLLTAAGAPENVAGNGFRVTHVSGRTLATPSYYSTAADGDADHDGTNPGGQVSATWSALLPAEAGYAAGELLPGESVTLTFNVVIQ